MIIIKPNLLVIKTLKGWYDYHKNTHWLCNHTKSLLIILFCIWACIALPISEGLNIYRTIAILQPTTPDGVE